MNVFRIASIIVGCFIILLLCTLLFVVAVPMDFYCTVPGRLVPAKVLRVSFPDNGVVDFIRQEAEFEKGDILIAQETEHDKSLLAGLKGQREMLDAQLAAQIQKYELERQRLDVETKKTILSLDNITKSIPMQQEQFESFTAMSEGLNAQKKLDEELKKQEAEIIETLYNKQVVAKLDFLKVLHDKKVAEIMSEQAKSQNAEKLFDYKLELGRMIVDQKTRELEKRLLEAQMPPDTEQMVIRLNMRRLDAEIAALEEKIDNRTFKAPFSGVVLMPAARKGELARSGEIVMEIADSSRMIFAAVADQNQRSDLKIGQSVDVCLDNYPYAIYGSLDGKLSDIQTNLSAAQAAYRLEITMNIPFDKYPPGLSGKAKVVVFHGTTLKYALRKR